jgi:ribosome-associated protein
MIHVTPTVAIDENDIQEEFVRASGPGGQNVNIVATVKSIRIVIEDPSGGIGGANL